MYLQPGQQPKRFAEVLGEGFSSVNDILNKARQAAMEREKQRQMMEHYKQQNAFNQQKHADTMAMEQQKLMQAHGLDALKQKVMEEKIKSLNNKTATETPDEKKQRIIDTDLQKIKNKEQFETNKNIEAQSEGVLKNINHLERIAEILKSNPNKTGRTNAFLNKYLPNETISALNAHIKPLQGEIARDIGQQGGYKVATLAEEGKPSANKSYEENKASVSELAKTALNNFNLLKEHYEKANPGKKYPHELPKSIEEGLFGENKKIWIITPKGKRVAMTPDQATWALTNGGRRG